jgi:hypothetical protein
MSMRTRAVILFLGALARASACKRRGQELTCKTCKVNDQCFVCPDEKAKERCVRDPTSSRCKWAEPSHCSAASAR